MFSMVAQLDVKFSPSVNSHCAWQEKGQLPRSRAPGTSLQKGVDAGPGLLNLKERSQLKPSRDGGDMRKGGEEPIWDVMQEDQRPTEWEECYSSNIMCKWFIIYIIMWPLVLFSFRRKNHLVLHHLHWSSVNTQAEYHASNTHYCKGTYTFPDTALTWFWPSSAEQTTDTETPTPYPMSLSYSLATVGQK